MTGHPFMRRDNSLVPMSEEAEAMLRAVKNGNEIMVSMKPARNIRHHKLLFAMLNLIVQHTGQFSSTDDALVALKIACGLVDPFIDAQSGKTFFVPRSISFSAMPQNDFSAFFDRAVYVVTTRWFPPGTQEADVRAEIESMCNPLPNTIVRRAPALVPA